MNFTKKQAVKAIYNKGFYPALHWLYEFETSERFEECKILLSAMEQVGNGRWWYLTTKTDEKSRKQTLENCLKGHSEIIRDNMPIYIIEFGKMINQ